MKHPLEKSELIGLVLLALLIAAVTGCALLVRGCGADSAPPPVSPDAAVCIIDSGAPAPSAGKKKASGRKPRKGRKKSGAKKSGADKWTPPADPFSDSVPVSW